MFTGDNPAYSKWQSDATCAPRRRTRPALVPSRDEGPISRVRPPRASREWRRVTQSAKAGAPPPAIPLSACRPTPTPRADEYMNPNFKESLPREWWQTSFQILPTDDVLQMIKNNDPKCTVLDGSCRQMQGSRIEMIAQQCKGNTSITEIDLRGNGFDSDGLYALVQALKTMPNVKKLNLRGNTCRNEGIEALAEFLKVSRVLQRCHRASPHIPTTRRSAECAELPVAAPAPWSPTRGTSARVDAHRRPPTPWPAQTNRTVEYLNLGENNLGTPGAKQIAEALKVNTTLTEVDLSLNYIDDEGGKAIAESLAVNTTLKVLGMSGNEIEDKDLRKKCRSRKL